jgi:hypothetical protein
MNIIISLNEVSFQFEFRTYLYIIRMR